MDKQSLFLEGRIEEFMHNGEAPHARGSPLFEKPIATLLLRNAVLP